MTMPRLLITRFPLESGSGGEEELHFLLADSLLEQKIETILWSSCPAFLRGFRKRKYFALAAFFVPDPTSRISLLLLPITVPILFLQAMVAIPAFWLKKSRTVLMLTFFEKCFLTPVFLLFGFRVVWAHHAPLGKWFFHNPLLSLWKKWSKSTPIIVPSNDMKKELAKVCAEENISVIPNAIRDLPKPDETFQKKLLQIKKGRAVGTVGRLSSEKNLKQYLKIADDFPKDTFFIAGDGPQKKQLEWLKKDMGLTNVIFLGRLENKKLSALYSVLDVYVSCSSYETFGLSIAEAASCGVPAVAPRIGGILDVVKDGQTGFLYKPNDTTDQKQKLKHMFKNTESRIQMEKAAKQHSKRFSPEHYRDEMKKMLFSTTNLS
jgi:glycosyltransferase involved in cell wall biosynthesis